MKLQKRTSLSRRFTQETTARRLFQLRTCNFLPVSVKHIKIPIRTKRVFPFSLQTELFKKNRIFIGSKQYYVPQFTSNSPYIFELNPSTRREHLNMHHPPLNKFPRVREIFFVSRNVPHDLYNTPKTCSPIGANGGEAAFLHQNRIFAHGQTSPPKKITLNTYSANRPNHRG